MKLARHDLVAALSLRYDHYSSQSLFEAACKRANLGDQEHYTAAEVSAFRAALAKLGDRLQRVDDRLDSLLGETPAAATNDLPAQAPQATAPMPAESQPTDNSALQSMAMSAAELQSTTNKPAQAPQATAPMPAAESQPTGKPAQASLPSTETPRTTTDKPAPMTVKGSDGTAPRPATGSTPEPVVAPTTTGKPAQAPQAPPKPAPSTEVAETRIVLSGVELADGDALFVCGDRAELGNWDPERARPMMRDGDAWIAVVASGEGSFKFLRRTDDGDVTWEGGENRDLGTAVMIETSWQP